jgi:hypothetical protein
LLVDNILSGRVHLDPEDKEVKEDDEIHKHCHRASALGSHLIEVHSFIRLPIASVQKQTHWKSKRIVLLQNLPKVLHCVLFKDNLNRGKFSFIRF